MSLKSHILFDTVRGVDGASNGSRYGYISRRNKSGNCLDLNFCLTPGLCFTVVLSNISINAAEDALFKTLFTSLSKPRKSSAFLKVMLQPKKNINWVNLYVY